MAGTRLLVQSYFFGVFLLLLPLAWYYQHTPRYRRFPRRRFRLFRRALRSHCASLTSLNVCVAESCASEQDVASAYVVEFVVLARRDEAPVDATSIARSVAAFVDGLSSSTGVAFAVETRRAALSSPPPSLRAMWAGARRDLDDAPPDESTRRLRFLLIGDGNDTRVDASHNAADAGGVIVVRHLDEAQRTAVSMIRAHLGLTDDLELFALRAARAGLNEAMGSLVKLRDVGWFMFPTDAADRSLDLLEEALQEGPARATRLARSALLVTEEALTSLELRIPGPYFPPEHLLAIYAPLIAPLVVPVTYSWFEEVGRYRRLTARSKAKDAALVKMGYERLTKANKRKEAGTCSQA